MLEDLFRPTHLIAVLAVVLLLFGPSKLPQLGGALGRAIRDFKKAVNGQGEEPARTLAAPDDRKDAARQQG